MPSDINNTGSIPVINGTVNGTTSWVITSTVNTVGTDPLTFTEFTISPTDTMTLSTAQTVTGAKTFGQVLGAMNAQTGTTYTVAQTDCGKIVKGKNAGAITITVPSTITGVCHVTILQEGAGQITVAAGASATLNGAFTKTRAQWAMISVSNVGATAADWILAGDGA
jgi:hypothetical protein